MRAIGSDLHMDYTAVGQTTHLAARMEQLAEPGSILLSPATLELAEGYVEVKPLGPVPVKGPARRRWRSTSSSEQGRALAASRRRRPWADPLRRPRQRGGSAPPGPGAGAAPGTARSSAVVGEPGRRQVAPLLGVHPLPSRPGLAHPRSRLRLLRQGHRAICPSSISSRRTSTSRSATRPRSIREKVTGKVLIARPGPGAAPCRRCSRSWKCRSRIAAWEAARSSAAPAADAGRRASACCCGRARSSRSCCSSRTCTGSTPRPRRSWTASSRACRRPGCCCSSTTAPNTSTAGAARPTTASSGIDPLPPESADELLDALLGADAALGPLKQHPDRADGGNPLFLEESVRALVGDDGAGRRARRLSARPARRDDPGPRHGAGDPGRAHRPPGARGQAAAPGRRGHRQGRAHSRSCWPLPSVPERRAAPRARPSPGRRVPLRDEPLPRPRVHVQARAHPRGGVPGLLHDRRRALHARITEAIERLSTERVAEQAERLAHHALRGGCGRRRSPISARRGSGPWRGPPTARPSPTWSRRSGPFAASRDPGDDRADHRHPHRPPERAPPARRAGAHGEHLHEAEVLARTLGDQHRLARIATFMVIQCLVTGDYDEAVRFGQEALSIARTLGDRSIEVVATSFLGMTHAARGEFSDAATLLERNVALEGDLRLRALRAPAIQSAFSGRLARRRALPARPVRRGHRARRGRRADR